MKRKLSVVLIVPNSNHFLPITLTSLAQELTACHLDWEIVVVGQIDQKVTDYVAKNFTQAEKIHFYDYPINLPYFKAFNYAFYKTIGDLVCFLDPGCNLPAFNIRKLLAHLDQDSTEIVLGSKFHPQSQTSTSLSLKIASYCYQLTNRLLFNLNLKDFSFEIKIFKRSLLEAVVPRLTGKLTAFDLEFLVAAQLAGAQITQAPVINHKNGNYEAPRVDTRGISSLASAKRNLAEAESSYSSTDLRPWSSMKGDKLSWSYIRQFTKEFAAIFFNLALWHNYDQSLPVQEKLLIRSQQLTV